MLKNSNTTRIRKQMVAIISVILILVTTIGYIALFEVFAAKNNDVNIGTVCLFPTRIRAKKHRRFRAVATQQYFYRILHLFFGRHTCSSFEIV